MNTTQIMSVAPQAETTKAAAAGSTAKIPRVQGKDAVDDRRGDSFGSALEKTQSQDTVPAKAETAGSTSPQEQAAAQETAVAEATGGKGKAFKTAAKDRRGVTAWVEREGTLRMGDVLRLHVPDQRPWAQMGAARAIAAE